MRQYRKRRMTERPRPPPDYLINHLTPLKQGRVVKLVQETKQKHGLRIREVQTLVLLAPSTLYGMTPGMVIVSVIGKGSCVIIPNTGKGTGVLVKAGMPLRLAVVLIEKLDELFGETKHGNPNQK